MSKGPKGAAKDIIKHVSDFVKAMNAHYKKLQKAKNKGKDPQKKADLFPLLTFKIGRGGKVVFRTPKEQATLLAQKNKKGKTSSARSAHMTDRARHVPVYVNGKHESKIAVIIAALGDDEGPKFKDTWVAKMKANDLYNGKGKQAWWGADWGHLELKDRELPNNSPLVVECLEWYVQLVGDEYDRLNGTLEDKESTRLGKIRTRLKIEKPKKPDKAAKAK